MLAGCFSLAPFLLPGAEQLTWLAGCRSTPSPRFTPSQAPSSTLRPVPLCTGINWITQPVLLHKIGPLYSGWGVALSCQNVGLCRCSPLCHYLLHLHTALALSLSPTPQASERARCVFPRLLPICVRAVGHSPPAWQRPSRSSWELGCACSGSAVPSEGWDQPHTVPAASGCRFGTSREAPWVGICVLTAFLCSPALLSPAAVVCAMQGSRQGFSFVFHRPCCLSNIATGMWLGLFFFFPFIFFPRCLLSRSVLWHVLPPWARRSAAAQRDNVPVFACESPVLAQP